MGSTGVVECYVLFNDNIVCAYAGQFGCVYEATLAKDARSSNDYGSLTHEKVAVKTIRGNVIVEIILQ